MARYPVALFLLAWLGGWTVGGLEAFRNVRNEDATLHWFLFFWLGAWAVGELFALFALYRLLAPARPERVHFEWQYLKHEPGSVPLGFATTARERRQNLLQYFGRPVRQIPKGEIGEVRLERVGERQRLTVDWGAQRIEIGAHLREPEREWLAAVLRQWATGRAS